MPKHAVPFLLGMSAAMALLYTVGHVSALSGVANTVDQLLFPTANA